MGNCHGNCHGNTFKIAKSIANSTHQQHINTKYYLNTTCELLYDSTSSKPVHLAMFNKKTDKSVLSGIIQDIYTVTSTNDILIVTQNEIYVLSPIIDIFSKTKRFVENKEVVLHDIAGYSKMSFSE